MKPIRVLHVFASLDKGGAETMIMNIYRQIDRQKLQFDFVVTDDGSRGAYEDEVLELGGRVLRVPKYTIRNLLTYKHAWVKLLDNYPEISIVHGHHTSPAYIYFRASKKMKRATIAHSHTASGERTLKSYTKRLLRYLLVFKSDYLFACSKDAASWMFGKRSDKTYVVKNAIDLVAFAFNSEARESKRKELEIGNRFVVGHIGRFDRVKNHEFLVDVFTKLKLTEPETVLLLVGDGALRGEIENNVKSRGLADSVIFTGVRSDVPELLSAVDTFVLPSHFEGFPVSAVEAAASGLPCIMSDTITNEACLTPQMVQVPIDKGAEPWVEKILTFKGTPRADNHDTLHEQGYDISSTTAWLTNFYQDILETGENK